jgi:hypothetical protein
MHIHSIIASKRIFGDYVEENGAWYRFGDYKRYKNAFVDKLWGA